MITTASLTWGGKKVPRTSQISSAIWTTPPIGETHAGPDDAPTTTAAAAGRAADPALLTSLSAKIDRCMGRIDSLETELGTSKKIMGGAILTLVSRVKKLERTVKQLRTARLPGHDQATVPSEDIEETRRGRWFLLGVRVGFIDVPDRVLYSAFGAGKAPMPNLEIPAEFLAEDAQARQRLEEEQASARLVQQLQAEDLAQADQFVLLLLVPTSAAMDSAASRA
ncbi:hypothetical protein Tco_1102512 [Tanacetum coccineum]